MNADFLAAGRNQARRSGRMSSEGPTRPGASEIYRSARRSISESGFPAAVQDDLQRLGLCPDNWGLLYALRPPTRITRRFLRLLEAKPCQPACWSVPLTAPMISEEFAKLILRRAVRELGFVPDPETTAWLL